MLFERFQRPRWRHTNPTVRRRAVQHLSPSDPAHAEILSKLTRDDPDAGVRAAASKRVNDVALLRECLSEDPTATVREAMRARYRQLLAGGDGSSLQGRLTELARCEDIQVLAHVARTAREEAMRAAALEQLHDSSVLEESALNDDVARIRQRAVARIADISVLQRLARRARRSDARVARFARDRAAQLQSEERLRGERAHEAEAVVAQLERLVADDGASGLAAAWQRLNNRWQAVATSAPAALRERFQSLEPAIGQRLAAEQEHAHQRAALQTALQAAQHDLRANGEPNPDSVQSLRDAQGDSPMAALDGEAQAWCGAAERYLQERDALEAAQRRADAPGLQAAIARIGWPQSSPQPQALMAARRRLAEVVPEAEVQPAGVEASASPREAPQVGSDADVVAALDRADAALARGELRAARRRVAEARSAAGNATLPRHQERRFAHINARIAELRDWRAFAVQPKQEALCRAMETLAEETCTAPPERAARIRELRAEWKNTGGTDSAAAQGLWKRFQAAADRAFEPCREWYAAEAERRQANLEGRRRVLEQLERFMGEQDPAARSVKQLGEIRTAARRDWQSFSPVQGDRLKPLAARFEPLMDRLTEIVEHQRELARRAKEAMCEEVAALAAGAQDEPEIAARNAKALQQRWRQAGAARPAADRALWKRFRAGCDVIFARRDEARRTRRAGAERQRDEAAALCARLESLALQEGDPIGLSAEIDRVAAAFRERSLPRGQEGGEIEARFRRAMAAAERQRDALRVRAAQRLWRRIDEAAERDTELPPGAPAPVVQAVTARRSANGELATEERARELCVQAEILGGVDSPPEDRERRMHLQMARLGAAFNGGGAAAEHARSWQLAAEWLSARAPDEALRQRFSTAMEAALASHSGH